MSSAPFTPFDYSLTKGQIQRTYNIAEYGYDLIFNIHKVNPASLTNVIASSATTTYRFQNTTNVPIRANTASVLTNKDSIILAGPAAKTQLNDFFEVTPDMDALIHEVNINVGFGLDIDTFDTGSPILSTVGIQCTYEDTGEIIKSLTNTFNTGFSALGAAGDQIFILNQTINPYGLVFQKGRSVLINFTTTGSFGTGNTTGHVGICQDFPYGKQLAVAAPIYYYPSSIFFHVHPTTTHVNPQYITQDLTP